MFCGIFTRCTMQFHLKSNKITSILTCNSIFSPLASHFLCRRSLIITRNTRFKRCFQSCYQVKPCKRTREFNVLMISIGCIIRITFTFTTLEICSSTCSICHKFKFSASNTVNTKLL